MPTLIDAAYEARTDWTHPKEEVTVWLENAIFTLAMLGKNHPTVEEVLREYDSQQQILGERTPKIVR